MQTSERAIRWEGMDSSDGVSGGSGERAERGGGGDWRLMRRAGETHQEGCGEVRRDSGQGHLLVLLLDALQLLGEVCGLLPPPCNLRLVSAQRRTVLL